MKFSSIIKITLVLFGVAILATACFKDLDTTPLDEDVLISDVVYDEPGAYKQVLAKLYASLSVTGQEGPAGQPDISGIDEGFGSQDSQGRDRLIQAITTIQDDFDLILVITHIEELKEAFPARIEVTKTSDGSVIELI